MLITKYLADVIKYKYSNNNMITHGKRFTIHSIKSFSDFRQSDSIKSNQINSWFSAPPTTRTMTEQVDKLQNKWIVSDT